MKYAGYIILFLSFIPRFSSGQIIADHTVVDKYDKIPQQYIDAVKKMLVNIGGMSHGMGYINGVALLELFDPKFQVLTFTTEPLPGYSDQYLRFGRPFMEGIQTFYTSQSAIDTYKSIKLRYGGVNNPYSVVGFGWSYHATWVNPPGGTIDPVYHVRWAGSSEGGPDGDRIWGLDNGDEVLTGNRVTMNTYLDAMEQYIQYCTANSYPTKMLFTNGVVDGNSGTESGFQRELKNQHIRDYIAGKAGYYFFDYADILVHNNAGEHYSVNWNDGGNLRAHDQIHPDNLLDYDASWNIVPLTDSDVDHIGEVGALRLGKAMWWMLARIAGWDGSIVSTAVPGIVDSQGIEVIIEPGADRIRINSADKYLYWQVKLYNLNGNLIESMSINDNISYLNASLLSSGLYLIVLSKDKIKEVKKIVLLR